MNNLLTKEEMAEKLNWSLKKMDRMIREHRDSFPRITFKDGSMVFPDGTVLKKFAPDPEREEDPEPKAAPAPDPFEEEGETPVYDDTPSGDQGKGPPAKPKPKPKPAAKKTTKK